MGSLRITFLVAVGSKKGAEQGSGRVSSDGALRTPISTNNWCLDRFCLNIGWLYTRLVASNSGLDQLGDTDTCDSTDRGSIPCEGTPLLSKSASAMLNSSIHEFMAMCALSIYVLITFLRPLSGNCIFRSN